MEQNLPPAQGRPLVFLHIPKTAGSTLQRLIIKNHGFTNICFGYERGSHYLQWMDAAFPRDKPVFMHHTTRWHLGHRLDGTRALTMLRRPLDRVVSLYAYCRRSADNRWHELIHREGLDLEGFLASEAFAAASHPTEANAMTNALCADRRAPGDERLASALAFLAEERTVFGLTERFDESLLLVAAHLGWTRLLFTRANVSNARPRASRLSAGTLSRFRDGNRLDEALYAGAARRFSQRLAALGPRFPEQLAAYRQANRQYQLRQTAHRARRLERGLELERA